MPDDQHRLNSRQRREIDQIGQKFHFNLAPPPSSLDEITAGPKFVSLTDFIEQFDWQYADLDIVDRRDIKHLAAVSGRLDHGVEREFGARQDLWSAAAV